MVVSFYPDNHCVNWLYKLSLIYIVDSNKICLSFLQISSDLFEEYEYFGLMKDANYGEDKVRMVLMLVNILLEFQSVILYFSTKFPFKSRKKRSRCAAPQFDQAL